MSKPTIAGRKPLSTKAAPSIFNEPDFFTNKVALAPELAKEISDKGLEYRFIDYKKYINEGNQHNRGWKVYKAEKKSTTDSFLLGDSPDGIIRRGSLVLAVRPVEWGDKHRAHLEQKRAVYQRFKQSKADELRQKAREAKSVVDDSYDEDDNE